jgi:hypothetical protein
MPEDGKHFIAYCSVVKSRFEVYKIPFHHGKRKKNLPFVPSLTPIAILRDNPSTPLLFRIALDV